MRVMISTMDQQPTQLTDMLSHAWVICTSKPMLFDWCVDNSKDGLSSPLAPGFAEGLRGVGGSWPLGATNSLEDVWCKTWDCLFQSIITSKRPYKGLHLQRYNGEYIYIHIHIRPYVYLYHWIKCRMGIILHHIRDLGIRNQWTSIQDHGPFADILGSAASARRRPIGITMASCKVQCTLVQLGHIGPLPSKYWKDTLQESASERQRTQTSRVRTVVSSQGFRYVKGPPSTSISAHAPIIGAPLTSTTNLNKYK